MKSANAIGEWSGAAARVFVFLPAAKMGEREDPYSWARMNNGEWAVQQRAECRVVTAEHSRI